MNNQFYSTTTTTINSTKYKDSFLHKEEECGIIFDRNINNIIFVDKFSKHENNVLNLISKEPKVIISTTVSFFHMYHDCIGEFLSQYEKTPEALFLIDITHIADMDNLPSFVKMFFQFLNDNSVNYKPINLLKFNKININNLYYRNTSVESLEINDPSPKIRKHFSKYIIDSSMPADKKVFLSRKNFHGRDLSTLIKGRLPYENDNRIDDEQELINYFKDLGFEIVIPEDFETFVDQINYFDKVKMIVSNTGSGFTNACFMREGGTMVELTTPLISFSSIGNGVTSPLSQGQEEIHHFYHMMSVALGHSFISIPNKTRKAKKIIEHIENNKVVKNILLDRS